MKKVSLMIVAMMFLATFAMPLYAGKVETGGTSLTISGEVEIDAVYRDEQFDGVLNAPGFSDEQSGDSFADIEITLGLDWQFTDKVSLYLELENGQTNSGNLTGRPGTFGYNFNAQAPGFGGSSGVLDGVAGPGNLMPTNGHPNSDFGGMDIQLNVEQAYIMVQELIWERLDMKAGLFDVTYDMRGNGSAFLFDLSERFNTNFGGWWGRLTFDNWFLEATVGTLLEDRLNAGTRRDNADLWILHGQYNFDENKGLLYAQLSQVNSDANAFRARRDFGDPGVLGSYDYGYTNQRNEIWTIAFGGLYNFTDWFELYGEAAFQFGEAGADLDGATVTGTAGNAVFAARGSEADANGWGMYVGGNFHWDDHAWKPYVDVSFWYMSGDEDGSGDSDDNEELQIWGNHNKSYIIENIDYGYGINTNYHALKIGAGVTGPEKDMFEDWNFDLMFAWYQVTETDKYADNTQEGLFVDPVVGSASDDLGIELDLTATYRYSDNLTFTWGAGFLFGSDFIADNYTTTDQETGLVDDGDDSGVLLFFDVTLKF